MVHGTRDDAEALREEIAEVLSTMGLRLSAEKTLITHIDEGLDFLGWHIQRHRKRGTSRCYVYTYPSRKAVKAAMGKVKAIRRRTATGLPLDDLLIQMNRMLVGWCMHFRPGVSSATFQYLSSYAWGQVMSGCAASTAGSAGRTSAAATAEAAGGQPGKKGRCSTRQGAHDALPLPGNRRPVPMANNRMRTASRTRRACGAPGALRAARRVRKRPGERARSKHRDRAPGRLHHRLFSHITMNWRGRPLTSHEVIVQTIAATTTGTGLRVRAELDTGAYDTGIKVSDRQMEACR